MVRSGSFVKRKMEAAVADIVVHFASLVWAPCCPIDVHQWVQTCGAAVADEEEHTLDIVIAAAAELGKIQDHHFHN